MTLYHPSPQETNTIIKRIFASLSNPSGGYKIKCPDEIITITKLGSRLWGTYSYQSDYDCLVIHSNPSKAVRHVGATIAAKEIDVRLESVDSFVEQMKTEGSVRCWLAFLLLLADTRILLSAKEKNQNISSSSADKETETPQMKVDHHSENQDDDETNEEDSSLSSSYRHTSVLFPQVPSDESEKVQHFIRHVISSVGALDPKAILSKVSETLIEDQQRVTKLIQQESGIAVDRVQKITGSVNGTYKGLLASG